MPNVPHDTNRYANNRIVASHRATWERERQMKHFRVVVNAQKFLNLHSLVKNLFNWGRHCSSAERYRSFRSRGFDAWRRSSYV
jgi:putative transposase